MHLSENEGIEGRSFVVSGGLGTVGSALCLELARRGARQVRSLHLPPHSPSPSPLHSSLRRAGVILIHGDVTKKKDVDKALRGADCVFHLASFGDSGKDMLQAGRVDDTNITGTCNVLDSCREFGIRRLVYLSSYNVVFGGKEILNGNEANPYYPIDSNPDPFGRSKCIAEQLVLKSNGLPAKSKNGAHLYTCAVRPALVYGPGEKHLLRLVSLAKLGLLYYKIGDENVKTDWVYVENLVLALLLASMGLLDDIPGREGQPVAAGQAYFINDGSPVNTFEFIVNPLLRSLGYGVPKLSMDLKQALIMSLVCWFVYMLLFPWLGKKWLPEPLILPPEAYKLGVRHYFSILKAREELGYIPLVSPRDGVSATVSYFQEKKRRELDGPTIYAWLFVMLGMLAIFCAAFLPPIGPLYFNYWIHIFVFRSVSVIRLVFVLAVVSHVGEGMYAYYLARKVDPKNTKGWFWQTTALGFTSLQCLLKRARSKNE
ncbi:Short-chain dehydrogenase/reductase family 42E member 1 [Rhynchospora pubera]|uniref:Short-chain dehydrogenase/reductase family 42E member 1 n=1 Tax=Rhynchospora pubera TaxID=906938 RepID=A0AAV8H2V7_9POAL|nr:Short-chain dehydrogenase/reductase family 42E member 1 [Rhynchospora pubera]